MTPASDLESAVRGATQTRVYTLGDASLVLAAFAVAALLLDSEGLLTWAQRIEVGEGQRAAVAVARPLEERLASFGLTAPRHALLAASARLGRSMGSVEDPLLAGGWSDPAKAPHPIASEEAPEDLALLDLVLAPADDASPEVEPAPVPPAEPAPAPAPSGQLTVLLVGDSMIAGSLGTELNKQLGKDERLHVVSAYQTATGLSRPDVYDWMKVMPALLEREHPRLVIASFGANDATDLQEDDKTVEFGGPGWRRAYARRVVAMMHALAGDQTRVLWLGLPPMRDERFAKKVASLNDICSRAARRTPRVEFLELDAVLTDHGGYATFVRGADGRLTRFRLDDGVHYSPAGARAVARWGIDWVKERVGETSGR